MRTPAYLKYAKPLPIKDPISQNHWNLENYRQRVTRKEAQYILLNHQTLIFNGRLYDVKAKSVGAGIYEIYKELKKI